MTKFEMTVLAAPWTALVLLIIWDALGSVERSAIKDKLVEQFRTHGRVVLGVIFTLVPMPIIFYLTSETEPKPSLKFFDVENNCKGELTATLLVRPEGNDAVVQLILDQWFDVRASCSHLEFKPPGIVSDFRSFPYSELKYRGPFPEVAIIGVLDFFDYSDHVIEKWHNGRDDIYYVIEGLDDFGGVLQFRWIDAVKRKSFTQKQLILQSGSNLKGMRVRLDSPQGYSFVLSSTSPVAAAYHRSFSDELSFDLKDKTGSWRTLSDLRAVFESDSRKTLRDALLITLSAVIGLGLAIVSERNR